MKRITLIFLCFTLLLNNIAKAQYQKPDNTKYIVGGAIAFGVVITGILIAKAKKNTEKRRINSYKEKEEKLKNAETEQVQEAKNTKYCKQVILKNVDNVLWNGNVNTFYISLTALHVFNTKVYSFSTNTSNNDSLIDAAEYMLYANGKLLDVKQGKYSLTISNKLEDYPEGIINFLVKTKDGAVRYDRKLDLVQNKTIKIGFKPQEAEAGITATQKFSNGTNGNLGINGYRVNAYIKLFKISERQLLKIALKNLDTKENKNIIVDLNSKIEIYSNGGDGGSGGGGGENGLGGNGGKGGTNGQLSVYIDPNVPINQLKLVLTSEVGSGGGVLSGGTNSKRGSYGSDGDVSSKPIKEIKAIPNEVFD